MENAFRSVLTTPISNNTFEMFSSCKMILELSFQLHVALKGAIISQIFFMRKKLLIYTLLTLLRND